MTHHEMGRKRDARAPRSGSGLVVLMLVIGLESCSPTRSVRLIHEGMESHW